MRKRLRKQQHFWACIDHLDGTVERFDWDMFGTLDDAILYAEWRARAVTWKRLEVSTEEIKHDSQES